MKLSEIIAYAQTLGCVATTSLHDSGQTVVVSYGTGADMVTWRGSFDWGDEDRFNGRLLKWLNTLPWPGADDPRDDAPEGAGDSVEAYRG